MPLYEYECRTCGHHTSDWRTVEQRHTQAPEHCGRPMELVIGAPAVLGDLPGYVSPTTGRWIEGRKARRDDLARSNCRPWEGFEQERKEAQRRLKYLEEKEDRALTEAAHKAWAELSPEKRRILENPPHVD